ncbi:hypothetical protein [Candidatus Nitrosocosmicus sp. SS]|jgi:hypothetical protein|uniref:hypothetical protein n=1 Tax=Candidatus Nitrosocosmicus agrestis TaxID=2563600 RepID=UPI00122DFFE1|nr:hypothetical protein [Candidatus Nitrosocosmicus sp. SS]KAA2282970.1 hypothetical protein F1Z66_04725 [Candidatus Nitrosocosmicus sp. SS]KAF0869173.1 hypothetical protein E5N71_07005 [Candidatus Nitrosocosmicus sp. SS]
MKIDRYLDKFNKKLGKIEKDRKEELGKAEKINEVDLLVKFDGYKPLKFERLKKHGQIIWDHALDAYEMTPDEFEYYLARYLYETTPEERYDKAKSEWFVHEHTTYGKVGIAHLNIDINHDVVIPISKAYGCTGDKCVPECKYYNRTGMIEDDKVIQEWMEKKTIVDLDQYKEELGEELFDKIIRDDDSYDRERMRQECIDHYCKLLYEKW